MVLKESLANVSKHAQARKVVVGLMVGNGELRIAIADDGCGFETNGHFAGSGLRNIRERTEQAGGSMKLESRPGSGTTVTVTIPMGNSHTNI
jgi:signal transduction histidine kinase